MTRPATTRFAAHVVPPLWSPAEVVALEATLASASRRLNASGIAVQFLQAIPGGADRSGTVCVFEAESSGAVRRVLEIAQVPVSRVEGTRRETSAATGPHPLGRQAFSSVLGSVRHGASGGGAPTP